MESPSPQVSQDRGDVADGAVVNGDGLGLDAVITEVFSNLIDSAFCSYWLWVGGVLSAQCLHCGY